MTEAEFQQQFQEFVRRLKHYPQVGRRPFGYPKGAWWLSGGMALFGVLLQLPLVLSKEVAHGAVVGAVFGVLLFACAFTMRVVAFTSAAHGAMDRWLWERVEAIERDLRNERAG